MNIYCIDPNYHADFAVAGLRGTWPPDVYTKGLCSECGADVEGRLDPLVFAWEPGSDIVGDFVWPEGTPGDVVVTDRARAVLEPFGHIHFAEVVMIDDPTREDHPRGRKRVRLPYKGPHLQVMEVEVVAQFDEDLSRARLKSECKTCGNKVWDFKIENIVVRAKNLNGAQIFRMKHSRAVVAVTEAVKEAIEKARLTNIVFTPFGRVL